jgi:hypothetical protein
MKGSKLVLAVIIALVVAFGVGFGLGAAGGRAAEHSLSDTQQQLDLSDARGHILEARVSLYNVNFGDAQRQLDDAKAPLTRARDRAKADGATSADALSTALTRVEEAQKLASRLDQTANARAASALQALDTARTR